MPSPARSYSDVKNDDFQDALDDFHRLDEVRELPSDSTHRISEQTKLVSSFYDIVTKFYEFGWGANFHFSPRRPGESFRDSQKRHMEGIGELLQLKPGMKVADIGSGVGGPMSILAKSSGASITGINFNPGQIRRTEKRLQQTGLNDLCNLLYADFMNVPLPDGTFDAMYSIEAAPHAPNYLMYSQELLRLLKPGGTVAIIQWCMTDKFDEDDERHQDIRKRIEKGNATSELILTQRFADIVQDAGFEIVQAVDQQELLGNPEAPWFMALQGRDFTLASWARSPAGRKLTAGMTRLFETLRIAPRGTSETARMLNVAADALVEGGELGIFTPSYLVHARKPA